MADRNDFYSQLVVHMDFYESPDHIPMCGMIVTDLNDRVLGQIWLCHPKLDEKKTVVKLSMVLTNMLEAGLDKVTLPRKMSPEAMENAVLEALAYVASLVTQAEDGSEYQSLVPAPLWASTEFYEPFLGE